MRTGTLAASKLVFTISTVSGMTSKTIGLAIREVMITLTGMFPVPSGLLLGSSLARKSSSVKNISTSDCEGKEVTCDH